MLLHNVRLLLHNVRLLLYNVTLLAYLFLQLTAYHKTDCGRARILGLWTVILSTCCWACCCAAHALSTCEPANGGTCQVLNFQVSLQSHHRESGSIDIDTRIVSILHLMKVIFRGRQAEQNQFLEGSADLFTLVTWPVLEGMFKWLVVQWTTRSLLGVYDSHPPIAR